jgi:CelD/BcsL family acetyltransferase involved in cellulose biosynthesis
MRVTRVSTTQELHELKDDWNCLTRGIPFRSWQWLFSWWKHYSQNRDLYVVTVRDDADVLIGAAPFFREQDATRGHVLRFLGCGEVCTDYLTILSTHEHQRVVAAAIAQWLLDVSADPDQQWDLLELQDVTTTDTPIAILVRILIEDGCSWHRREGMNCWRLALPDSWESFLASASKNRRRQFRRWNRAFSEAPGAKLHVATTLDELRTGMRVLVNLHQRRRESLGESGCFRCVAFSNFLHETATLLLETGRLQLYWIEIEGQPLAVDFNLLDGDTVYAYQSGIEPEATELSPGNLLTTAVLRQSMTDGRRVYDFLRGDEPYKAQLGAKPCPTFSYRVAANRLGPQLRQSVWTAGFKMKSWVKSGLTSVGVY